MPPYSLIIFDMDGTLTEELLDFDAIRREVGLPNAGGILEHLATLTGPEHARVTHILHRHEHAAAETCQLHEGVQQLLSVLKAAGIRTALLTRNSAACTARILSRHNLMLDHVATREDRPHKPHPDAILNIARRFNIPIKQTLMVGDYLYDLQAAQAAHCDSALLCTRDGGKLPPFATMATYCVTTLTQLLPILVPPKETQ